ncbi:phosphatase PAP2 family protein [Massilia sp. CFBP9012]|uniref:phosphatase PAP2 family protein n=1 Tax=Massilia sp. CFBP9012 TaxID=3096531 RepID=UPI002A6A07AA|nr:phosphatase PAP2 family protein [Massilia sp. CFBP9012]
MGVVATSNALLPARAIRRMAAALAAAALVIIWIGRCTDIDLALADAVFDAAGGVFPWRHAWLAETFSHVILKWLLMLLAVGFVGRAVADLAWPRAGMSEQTRLRLRIVALSALLVPVAISMLKQLSTSHCPWDLLRYGGDQPYVRLFEALPAGAVAGQCLPAGHASSALWLLSLAVYWLPARPRMASAVAALALAFGAAVGYLQQLRGAHFMTHTLWSIWIACAIVLFLAAVLRARPSRRKAPFNPLSEAVNVATADQ